MGTGVPYLSVITVSLFPVLIASAILCLLCRKRTSGTRGLSMGMGFGA